jgi:hypothetical protein
VTFICHHCEEEKDTAQHTLEFYPAWEEPRRFLRLDIGERLAPEAVVDAMLRGHQEFIVIRSYCKSCSRRSERRGIGREDAIQLERRTEGIPHAAGLRHRRCPRCVKGAGTPRRV